MKSLPFLLRYTLSLILVLGIAFWVHTTWRSSIGLTSLGDLLVPSYLIQAALALGIVAVLYLLRQRFKNLLGFLFIAGSLLKFLFFFLYFYPPYKADGQLDGSEFAAFFVPYGISLVLETVFAAQMLRRLEKDDEAGNAV
ncbi:hypothetical protein SAMN04490243_1109 [Robiginitalea myxolifaciens]|uniref:Uncharacterized protein n=1 Tax=Robiginitalea myxolifaciens TaxID=400055 RepID=A0A1I6G279_9FLAO|nr:DUF6168 family protein [Robiginitalea myxolifaciens]SFR36240.1 hypothetical protein SAMN04490243_1109 [Robiginitalea myxolifaciens]